MRNDRASCNTNAFPAGTNLPDGPSQPELREGELDPASVEQHFAELAACTQILAILEKGGGRQDHATSGHPNLVAARDRFLSREVLAVQIRYRFENAEWIDTLLHAPTGIRAVRCRQP